MHGLPIREPAYAVQGGGDDPGVVVEGDDRQLGQEHGQERVGLLLLAVRQGLGHCVPGVQTRLQWRPRGRVHETRFYGMIEMLE